MVGSSFWEYVRRAFHAKVPVQGLGPISLNKWLLFGAAILGFGAHPVWLLALGVEVLYLYALATNPRFRNVIDGEKLLAASKQWEERVGGLKDRLDRASVGRFESLAAKCREVQSLAAVTEVGVAPIEEAKTSGMDQLIYMYLRLLVSRAMIDSHFSPAERDKVRREIEGLEKDVARPGVPETVKKSKQGILEIGKRRLENLDRAAEQRAVIDSELERIEQQVELIREDTAMGREPAALSGRIDQVVSTLGETSEWMRKNADLIGDVGEDKPREVPIFLERGKAKEGG
jgi:hypothetical protein